MSLGANLLSIFVPSYFLIVTYTEEATYEWVPAGGSYRGTEDYDNKQFLGYTFNKIICADD